MAGCGGTPQKPVEPTPTIGRPSDARHAPDPDLNRQPAPKLLAIDWSAVALATDADALALWEKIAPTGDDWDEKLDEVPATVAHTIAIAFLRSGNFTCMRPVPVRDCAPPVFDVDPPAHTARLTDPCLRRLLALWSIAQLEPTDLPKLLDPLRAIVAIPPPESQLVSTALRSIPESDSATLLELLSIAWRAGQRELVNATVGRLDEARLIEAATRHHIDGALEILSARGHRATYLAAINDEAMGTTARTQAIGELLAEDDAKVAPDLRTALVKAAASPDCTVAATAARALEQRGDKKLVPARPRTLKPEPMMRALCVLASYEQLQRADEGSLLPTFVAPKGLERVQIAYDALSDVDTDGDGDPHTQRTVELVDRKDVVLPEIDDMVRALRRCTGTICLTSDREFRFTFKPIGGELMLSRLEIVERPPCRRP